MVGPHAAVALHHAGDLLGGGAHDAEVDVLLVRPGLRVQVVDGEDVVSDAEGDAVELVAVVVLDLRWIKHI